ncbi:C40 family peptidase [Bacillus massiliglaciei]|uniref:C40 family peptidase n=1 Tax=Bacillus massiliglaciei TaxID=1816693 RepID=UPI000B16B47C|nr:C40 family peptidase [Bacillus massiliglaciei]
MSGPKWIVILLSLVILFSGPVLSKAEERESTAYIDVAAATLWTEPGLLRDLDAPSASHPVDLKNWTGSMSYEDKLWLVGNLETQALYGSRVTILEEKGDWVKVAAANQPTPRNSEGYPGWMPKKQLVYNRGFGQKLDRNFAIVTSPSAWLYKDQKQKKRFLELSFDTRLPVLQQKKDAIQVMTPGAGAKWISKMDASVYKNEDQIPVPAGETIVETGEIFLGLPYLWAGMSGFGFDCSGFTYTVYHANGITIPRDSSVQAVNGTPVNKEDWQAGDLLFFGYDEGKGKIHHVGIYIGDGKMIHSPNSSTHVRIDEIAVSGYGNEYAGARRYIK